MINIKEQFLEFCKNEKPIPFIPTEQQQRAIFEKINVVPAGAGSGKTAVLSHRFLYLVMCGIHSDEILTMTFTKDATANMKKRIYGLLSDAVKANIISPDELDRFSASTITTTDGFCSEIAKSSCATYGISSNFQIESKEDLEIVADTLTDVVLRKHEGEENLEDLLTYWSVSNLKDFFKALSDVYISISNPIDFSLCKKLVKKSFANYTAEELDDYIVDFLTTAQAEIKPSNTLLSKIQIVKNYIDNPSYENLSGLANLSGNVKQEIKDKMLALADYAKGYSAVCPESLALLDFMCRLGADFQSEIIKHKRETGLVTYRDILLMAIDILRENTEIRNYYRSKFKAIMVDEFQDNNDDNKNLVYLLAANDDYKGHTNPTINEIVSDKVFMVGDEKQSIYRFRNADVSVFKKMANDFGQDRVAQLQQNYRSESKLIETINKIFERVFDGAYKDYEASYTSLNSSRSGVDPQIKIYSANDLKNTDEAYNVAKVIANILGDEKAKYQIPTKNGLRDPEPSDIAILLKSGTHQINYEEALKAFNIPYEAIESKSLTLEAIAYDIFNILQLAVWGRQDEISLLSFERSPLGFDNSLIEKVRSKLAVSSIAQTLSYIWNDLGYRFFILRNKKNSQYAEHYSYLFEIANAFDQKSKTIVDFLDYLRPLLGDEFKIKDFEIQRESESGVKIMSIHKSKGLEYPIVIIPDMHAGSRGGGFNPNIRALGSVISFPYVVKNDKLINPFIDKETENNMELAETKRVLYVAATRAQYHLIFSGIEKTGEAFKGTMFGLLLEASRGIVDVDSFDHAPDVEETEPEVPCYSESWYEDTYDFKFTKLTNAITSLDIEKTTSFADKLNAYDSDNLITSWTDFGTYVHSILEMTICNKDVADYFGPFVNNPNKAVIQKDALAMRDNFINSSFYKGLDGFNLESEKGFFYYDYDRNEVMEGVVDLLCVGPDKVIIVDYKTDKYKDPSTHKGQLETYKKAMEDFYKKPVMTYLFYVRSGEAVEV